MIESIEQLMDEYLDRFGEQFPRMMTQGLSDEKVAEEIRLCLESGEPFAYDPNLIY